MLGFLEKLTLDPEALTSADLAPLRAAGLSDAAKRELHRPRFCVDLGGRRIIKKTNGVRIDRRQSFDKVKQFSGEIT